VSIDDLRRIAEAHGVTTSYHDAMGIFHEVPESTLRHVLAAMGIDPERTGSRRRPASPLVVVRAGGEPAPAGDATSVVLATGEQRPVDGAIPADLPLGWHELLGPAGRARLVVAPPACHLPPALAEGGRLWGWTLQLYSLRSGASWGIGDLRDLDELLGAKRFDGTLPAPRPGSGQPARGGPAFALLNPLHDTSPAEASPYYPSSRVFRSPLYLHVEAVGEVGRLDLETRARFEQLVTAGRHLNAECVIDRQAVHALKDEALRLCHAVLAGDPERRKALDAWRAATPDVDSYAAFCAIQRELGADWHAWPEAYRRPDGPAVRRFAAERATEVDYHAYLQWLLTEQLMQACSRQAGGHGLGVVNDVAVGFDPGGFDAWAFQDELAPGVTVGAPPDEFNPRGQDWSLPAFVPERLSASGHHPFAATIRAAMAGAGGIRIDHVMGMFRLFWIPEGASPADGTFVRYPADELLSVLALESQRAEALVIGEDLGTVEPGVRERLAAERVLSYRVAWFEEEHGRPRPAAAYPGLALATVTTHDLPTTGGFFSDADLAEQRDLGLVGEDDWQQALARHHGRRGELHGLLEREGLLQWWEHDLDTVTAALYAFLARTPSMLVGVSLDDVLGSLPRPNVPGTTTARPNWSIPLPLELEDVLADPRLARLAERLRDAPGPS
jgi:4-alpha-glucanotransferase